MLCLLLMDEEMKEYENCIGKYMEFIELVECIEGVFCLVLVFSFNGIFYEDVMVNCCCQLEERFILLVWEGGLMFDMSFFCYQVCMVKNGLQDRE